MLRGLNEIVIHRLSGQPRNWVVQGSLWEGKWEAGMQKREEGLLLTIYLFVICFVEFSVVLDCKVTVGNQDQEGGMSSCLTSAGASQFLPLCAGPRMILFAGRGSYK